MSQTITTFYLSKEIVPSTNTTFWAIRLTISTVDRNKEIYLTEPISYQRYLNLTITVVLRPPRVSAI